MVNKFGSLSLQGKSIGKLTFAGRNLVGANADVAVAMLNVNNTLNTENVTPQAGFDFSMAFGTALKLIDAKIIAGTARSNQRSGARVATKTGTLLPMSDAKTDAVRLLVNIIYIIESKYFKIKIIITYTINCLYNALRIYQSE